MPGCRAWTGSRGGELELSAGEKGGRRKFPLVVLSGWHQRERSVGPLSLKAKDSQRRIPKGRGRRGQIPIGPGQASGLRVWVLAQEQVGNFRHCWDKEQEKGQGLVNEMGAEGGGRDGDSSLSSGHPLYNWAIGEKEGIGRNDPKEREAGSLQWEKAFTPEPGAGLRLGGRCRVGTLDNWRVPETTRPFRTRKKKKKSALRIFISVHQGEFGPGNWGERKVSNERFSGGSAPRADVCSRQPPSLLWQPRCARVFILQLKPAPTS